MVNAPLECRIWSCHTTLVAVRFEADADASWICLAGLSGKCRSSSSDTHMEPDSRIVLHNVTVRYGRRIALEAVSGEFPAGSLTAVVGANGAGKSTLLAAIAGVVRLAGGTVNCPARQRLAYLPQLAAIDCDYPLTVAELIALGGWREFGAFRSPGTALRARATAAAETVGLATRLGQPIAEISVGELQRALFARLLLQDAAVILLDEPFAAIDAQTVPVLLD